MNRVLIDIYWFIAFLYPLLSNKKGIDTYGRITSGKSTFDYLLSQSHDLFCTGRSSAA